MGAEEMSESTRAPPQGGPADSPHNDALNKGRRPGDAGYLWNPDYNFSRDFTGGFINFWTCNNGYHTIHHVRPSMHWTKYSEESRKKVLPYQHPELRQRNIVWYAIRTFFLNQRVTWDGRAYIPTESEPNYDLDWVDVFFKIFQDPHRIN